MIIQHDEVYLDLMRQIRDRGVNKGDRTGTGTRSLFGTQMRFDLSQGHIPLLTTKKVPFKTLLIELLWFISGSTNMTLLAQKGVKIWDAWPCKYWLQQTSQPVPKQEDEAGWKDVTKRFVAEIIADPDGFGAKWGELGPVYGKQWRAWKTAQGDTIDQLADVIKQITESPNSRRMIVCAWNPGDIPLMLDSGLPPCHCLFQFYVADGKLSCMLYQRSADYFLGVPFNIASYSVLTAMIAEVCGLQRGEFVWTGADTHLYRDHLEGGVIDLQLGRTPRESPKLIINSPSLPGLSDLFSMVETDFEVTGYTPDPGITAKVSV